MQPASLAGALRPETLLVSVMLANNETGAVQPVRELARLAHQAGAFFHTDAVQAFGKLPIDVEELGVDTLAVSAHKLHGPKGVGALYLRKDLPLEPLIRGGGRSAACGREPRTFPVSWGSAVRWSWPSAACMAGKETGWLPCAIGWRRASAVWYQVRTETVRRWSACARH